jgi:hypothetical protein
VNTLTPIYFLYISIDWINLAYTAFLFAAVSLVLTFFVIPETPRFYYSQEKYDEARKVLAVFYKWNIGSKN